MSKSLVSKHSEVVFDSVNLERVYSECTPITPALAPGVEKDFAIFQLCMRLIWENSFGIFSVQ